MAVIDDICAIAKHPYEKLTPMTLAELKDANASLNHAHATRANKLMRLLECILQIWGLSISYTTLGSMAFTVTIQSSIGLLIGGKVLNVSDASNADYARHLGKLHDKVCTLRGSMPSIHLSSIMSRKNEALRDSCIQLSNALKLDTEKAWAWQGWTVRNSYHTMHLSLYAVYTKYGRAFTERLYDACTQYFEGRTTGSIECLDSLTLYLSSDLCTFTSPELLDQQNSRIFFVQLANFHIQFNLGKGKSGNKSVSQHVLINDWNAHFRTFAVKYLIPCNVIGAPHIGHISINDIPLIPGQSSNRARALLARSKTIDDGVEVKLKTITPLPMHVMDDSVIEALFEQMRVDLKSAVRWAELSIKSIEMRLDEIVRIAETSVADLPPAHNSNLSEAMLVAERIKSAKIYTTSGFFPHRTFYTRSISPSYNLASSDLSEWLCLPKTQMLTSFTIYIAAKHEGVTNSFLDKCVVPSYRELPQHRVALTNRILVGAKPRAGMDTQEIELNDDTAWAVEILIRLTAPARRYLEQNDTDPSICEKLFIGTGKGFGVPNTTITKNLTGSSRSRALNAQSIEQLLSSTPEEASYLASNLSVNTTRATSVVLKVIDQMDLTVASDRLKHALFDLRLLKHYVPKLILLYLMRREITSWSTRVLIQALDNHPNTPFIAGFKSEADMDSYLSKVIELPFPIQSPPKNGTDKGPTVIFGIDEEVVCVLASLEQSVLADPIRATPFALYWAGLYGALNNWIHSSENDDDYLVEIFKSGTQQRNIKLVERVAYEN